MTAPIFDHNGLTRGDTVITTESSAYYTNGEEITIFHFTPEPGGYAIVGTLSSGKRVKVPVSKIVKK